MVKILSETKKGQKIKCVVWDLDNTIWNGVLLEGDDLYLRDGIVEIIKTLDSRGILQSIASKNDCEVAFKKLQEFGLSEYFLYPQINWNPKSNSIRNIAQLINIGLDTFAFIDDQPYEREEVAFSIPDVLCIDSENLDGILGMPEMNPRFITDDSRHRRVMYLGDIKRKEMEDAFAGPQDEFLASLGMVFSISNAKEEDLQRVEELTVRTHQLNTTGYTYSYEELDILRKSDGYKFLVTGLEDKFGTYGKIGVALVECGQDIWTLKLLLMSCRVISRGVGTILLNHIMKMARQQNAKLRAEFIENDKNRMMYVSLKFAGFKEIEQTDGLTVLENDYTNIQPFPDYIKVNILD